MDRRPIPRNAPVAVRSSTIRNEAATKTLARKGLKEAALNAKGSVTPSILIKENSSNVEAAEEKSEPDVNFEPSAVHPAAAFLAALTLNTEHQDEVDESSDDNEEPTARPSTIAENSSASDSVSDDTRTMSSEEEFLSDTTGHSPISAKLRFRIQHDQLVQRRRLQKRLNPLKSSLRSAEGRGKHPNRNSLMSTARDSFTSDGALSSLLPEKSENESYDETPEALQEYVEKEKTPSSQRAPCVEQEKMSRTDKKSKGPAIASTSPLTKGSATGRRLTLTSKGPSNSGSKSISTSTPSFAKNPKSTQTQSPIDPKFSESAKNEGAGASKVSPASTKSSSKSSSSFNATKTAPAAGNRRKSVFLTAVNIPPQSTHLSKKPRIGDPHHLSTQYLVPELCNNEERRRTVTIVFDLDETLVNNRRRSAPLFRPHTFEVLKSLRGEYPHPVYRKSKTTAGDRLYDLAFKQFGLAPSPQAQRSSSSFKESEQPGKVVPDELRVEIILWTASVEAVGRPVVATLDPSGVIFDQTIYRDFRWYREVDYTKDLRRLGRDMDRVVIVENSPASVSLNRKNSILVSDFVSRLRDKELLITARILKEWMITVRRALGLAGSSAEISAVTTPSKSCGNLINTMTLTKAESSPEPSKPASIFSKPSREASQPFKSVSSAPNKGGQEKFSPAVKNQDPTPASPSTAVSEEESTPKESYAPSGSMEASSASASLRPSTPNPADDVRVFLSQHRYIASSSNYLCVAEVSTARDSNSSASCSSAPRKKVPLIRSSGPKTINKKPSEPVWKRLYALAEKEVSANEPETNMRKMQPPPPSPEVPQSAMNSPTTKKGKKTITAPFKGKRKTNLRPSTPSNSFTSTITTSSSSDDLE